MRALRGQSGSDRRGRLARDRRGATLVTVALSLVVLVGFVGVGVDFAKVYAARTRLKTVTDAGALAGVLELVRGRTGNTPRDTALYYAKLNPVEGQTALDSTAVTVVPIKYNFATHSQTPVASFSPADGANAIKVKASYSVPTLFSAVVQQYAVGLRDSTVAAVGGTTQSCVKPWVVSYQDLLNALYPSPKKDTSYVLSATDIQRLQAMKYPADSVQLRTIAGAGGIGDVAVSDPWNTTKSYSDAITGCGNKQIGTGDTLYSDAGLGQGKDKAIKTLCGSPNHGNTAFDCANAPNLKLAVYSSSWSVTPSKSAYVVKYVAFFEVDRYDPGHGSAPAAIMGVFKSMPSNGGFGGPPGIITKGGVVY